MVVSVDWKYFPRLARLDRLRFVLGFVGKRRALNTSVKDCAMPMNEIGGKTNTYERR